MIAYTYLLCTLDSSNAIRLAKHSYHKQCFTKVMKISQADTYMDYGVKCGGINYLLLSYWKA